MSLKALIYLYLWIKKANSTHNNNNNWLVSDWISVCQTTDRILSVILTAKGSFQRRDSVRLVDDSKEESHQSMKAKGSRPRGEPNRTMKENQSLRWRDTAHITVLDTRWDRREGRERTSTVERKPTKSWNNQSITDQLVVKRYQRRENARLAGWQSKRHRSSDQKIPIERMNWLKQEPNKNPDRNRNPHIENEKRNPTEREWIDRKKRLNIQRENQSSR